MTYKFKLSRRLAASHLVRTAAVVAAVALTTACGASGPTDPSPTPTPTPQPAVQAGWLTIEFTTPRADDGAVQIGISGPGIDTVRAATPFQGVGGTASTQSAFVVVTGTLRTGTVARVHVPDVNRATQYTATVQAVAQKGTYDLRTLSGYSVAVVR